MVELDSLAERFALNFAAQEEQKALACDGRVAHWNGVSFCDARSSHWYRNSVVPTRDLDPEQSDELGERVLEFFSGSTTWVVGTSMQIQPSNGLLINHLSEELLVCAGGPIPTPTQSELDIREAREDSDMADFETAWATAYGHFHLLEPNARRYDHRVLGNGHRKWVGYLDGRPVATSASYLHSGVNMIRAITTHPDYRGRGIGSAMTLTAMAAGDVPRVLSSEPGVEPLYQGLGFTTVGVFRFWSSPQRR